jgi:hypothetical protein
MASAMGTTRRQSSARNLIMGSSDIEYGRHPCDSPDNPLRFRTVAFSAQRTFSTSTEIYDAFTDTVSARRL